MPRKHHNAPKTPVAPLPTASLVAEVPDVPVIPVPVSDAAVLIYKDRAGTPMVTGLTEGASNFATITAEAIRAAAHPQE